MFAIGSGGEPQLVPLRLQPTYLVKVSTGADGDKGLKDVKFTHCLETAGRPCPLLTRCQYQVRSVDLSHLGLK